MALLNSCNKWGESLLCWNVNVCPQLEENINNSGVALKTGDEQSSPGILEEYTY
jgi:hypothetical protein